MIFTLYWKVFLLILQNFRKRFGIWYIDVGGELMIAVVASEVLRTLINYSAKPCAGQSRNKFGPVYSSGSAAAEFAEAVSDFQYAREAESWRFYYPRLAFSSGLCYI